MQLSAALYSCVRFHTVAYGSMQLYTALCSCIRFYTVVYGSMRLYAASIQLCMLIVNENNISIRTCFYLIVDTEESHQHSNSRWICAIWFYKMIGSKKKLTTVIDKNFDLILRTQMQPIYHKLSPNSVTWKFNGTYFYSILKFIS